MATAAPRGPRDLVADAIAAEGPAYRNLADNVRTGGIPNMWVRWALKAAEAGMRFLPSADAADDE